MNPSRIRKALAALEVARDAFAAANLDFDATALICAWHRHDDPTGRLMQTLVSLVKRELAFAIRQGRPIAIGETVDVCSMAIADHGKRTAAKVKSVGQKNCLVGTRRYRLCDGWACNGAMAQIEPDDLVRIQRDLVRP